MDWRRGVETVRVLRRAGFIAPIRPDRLVRAALAGRRFGLGLGTAVAANAALEPDGTAIIDDDGPITYRELDEASNAVARGLYARGVATKSLVALRCRNHGDFVVVAAAIAKLGADLLPLNTDHGPEAVRAVLEREAPKALVHDDDLADRFGAQVDELAPVVIGGAGRPRSPKNTDADTVGGLIARSNGKARLDSPGRTGGLIILTSGTTGTPKGATRDETGSTSDAFDLLARVPLRVGEPIAVPAPLFHAWGLGNLGAGLAFRGPIILCRRFDAAALLADIDRYRVTTVAAVPVMLRRLLEAADDPSVRLDSLRVVFLSGSAIPAGLAEAFMDRFGDVVFNLYGSTEVGSATLATPEDLRAAPGTAGRPIGRTVIRILGDDDRELAPGEEGRIFVGSALAYSGYTDGTAKPTVGDLIASGDMGYFDANGRLFVAGRDDDMIVSGGENLFPREVEDVLVAHPGVREVAVVGVTDEEFGMRLAAWVVAADPDDPVGVETLRTLVREHLARFKVPRDFTFVDALPRNATGKILRRELRATVT